MVLMFRGLLATMLNPAFVLKSSLSHIPWYYSLAVSASAFLLFFLQTGLDLYKTGQKGLGFVFWAAGTGALYGALVIPVLGVLLWLALRMVKAEKGVSWAVSSFCLSYSGALVYGILGLLFSLLLGWRTSIAFGVTGVLWATGPLITAVREMTGGKTALAVILSSFVGAVILYTWSFFGRI